MLSMDTLKLSEQLEKEQVFPADLDTAVLRLEVKISESQKELIKWFAGIMIVQGVAVIGGTATLVHMLK